MNLVKIGGQIRAEHAARIKAINERWSTLGKVMEAHYAKQGRTLDPYQKANTFQLCENQMDLIMTKLQNLSEATQSDAIAFQRQMLPVIPAISASLVSEMVASVQALDRPAGDIYLMKLNYGTTKGAVTSGDTAISALTGHASSEAARLFASDYVINTLLGTGDGSTVTFTATLKYPTIASTIIIRLVTTATGAITITGVDNGAGAITGTGIASGSIDYATGALSVTLSAAPASTSKLYVYSYRFDIEKNTAGIGELNFDFTPLTVTTKKFPLKLNMSLFSQLNAQKLYNIALADEGMKFATQEIRFAIDQIVLKEAQDAALSTNAAVSPGTFDASPVSGDQWIFRIHEFKKYLSQANLAIFNKTLRVQGNVIVAGLNVCALFDQLPEFKSSVSEGANPGAGPHLYGTYRQFKVIANPFMDANSYTMAHRGDNIMDASVVFAPYQLMMSTDPVTLADFNTQRGFCSQAAVQVVNPGMLCQGYITGY